MIQVSKANNDGATPIYVAAEMGHHEVVELLLAKKGIQVNQAMDDGATPLYIAAQKGHLKIVEALLER